MSHETSKLVVLLVLLLGVLGGFFLLRAYFPGFSSSPTAEGPRPAHIEVQQAMREGNLENALALSRALYADANASAEEKAIAVYATLGAEYKLTGNIQTRVADVQKMKQIVLNESVSARMRANTLNALAGQYAISGTDPLIFDEIYKEAPFSNYLAEGNPRLSARRLFEWSYEIMPTSYAAIAIAAWYTEQVYFNPNQDSNTTQEYADIAVEYLNNADAASMQEEAQDETYLRSTRYMVYRYWRAVVIGRLAIQKGEPYQGQYRSTYENFIENVKTGQNALGEEYLHYARLFYAGQLIGDGDRAGGKTQLDTLAAELNALTNPAASVFMRFLKNQYTYFRNDATWRQIETVSVVSPNFRTVLERVVGATLD